MIEAYWLIGKQIVEAQAGNERAEYGTQLLKFLSEQLTRGILDVEVAGAKLNTLIIKI
jgi:hypothetical protein